MDTPSPEFCFCEDRDGRYVSQWTQRKEERKGEKEEMNIDKGIGNKNFSHTEEIIND